MQTLLSYSEYEAWCRSRVPETSPARVQPSLRPTLIASLADDEACPITVRSFDGQVVITPWSRGSR